MFDVWLRALKDRWLEPLARSIGARVHPNALTLLAFALGLASAWALSEARYGWGGACWAANRVLDGLDGTHARLHAKQSDLGGYLDILLDFGVYSLVPIGLAYGVGTPEVFRALGWLLASFFVNAASVMYLAAVLEKRDLGAAARGERTTVTMPPGLVAGAETVVLFSLFIAFPRYLPELFTLMAVLVGFNLVQRLVWAHRRL